MTGCIKEWTCNYKALGAAYFTDLPQEAVTSQESLVNNVPLELNDGTVIQRIGDAWSENIHKTPGQCTCWRDL
jgi:hypothetical protein